MDLIIKYDSDKGRGVYSKTTISKNTIVEVCELLLIKLNDVPDVLEGYIYQYNTKLAALALGNGSLYNHSDKANCDFSFNHRSKTLLIKAKRQIGADEELTINYRYNKSQKKRFRIP